MACGKSSIGLAVATALEVPFYDLDELIEEKAGKSIAKIFEEEGESHFRQLESECLKKTEALPKGIIATGGGAPCFFDNMRWMTNYSTVIFLQNTAKVLAKRLIQEKEHRPLVNRFEEEGALLQFIEQKLRERAPFYRQASIIINGDEKSIAEIVELIQNKILQN